MNSETISKIFAISSDKEFTISLQDVFAFQYHHNIVYKQWCNILNIGAKNIANAASPVFLPISFFKTHIISSSVFTPQICFESSGTTISVNSKHLVKDVKIYEQSFETAFQLFYGDVKKYCIIGLLPSYLERKNSSLVYMVDKLIAASQHKRSGFYLYNYKQLQEVIVELENNNQPTIIFGVSFALLDFAEQFSFSALKNITVIETGGMKGRREEITRNELHDILKNKLGLNVVHSEYSMTELLSQAYSLGNGKFVCPPWMKVLVRDEEDPLHVKQFGKGAINIIDLANVYSCSFIATDDVGIVYEDGSFEILGRLDNCDIRGCSQLAL